MTGIEAGIIFIVLLAAFLLVDLVAFVTGETLSQWIVKKKSACSWFRWLLIALLATACAFLLAHFELLQF